jgi:hypothetical protein
MPALSSAVAFRAALKPLLTGFALLAMTGCAGEVTTGISPTAGLSCVDDSPDCIAKRQATLRHLNSDHQRAWIGQSASPEAYASGVRLFAYKEKKSQLTCNELKRGKQEADAAPRILRGAEGKLAPGQISRGVMLASEVGRELGREIKKRC